MNEEPFISKDRSAWYKDKQEFLRAHKEWHDKTYPPKPYFPDARPIPTVLFDGLVQAVNKSREEWCK